MIDLRPPRYDKMHTHAHPPPRYPPNCSSYSYTFQARVPSPESREFRKEKRKKKALWAGMGEVNKRTDKLPSLPSFLLSASCFGKSWRGDFQVLGEALTCFSLPTDQEGGQRISSRSDWPETAAKSSTYIIIWYQIDPIRLAGGL